VLTNPGAGDDNKFKSLYKQAIALVQKADAARPNHYSVLQSLARIYADPRFDPSGDNIDKARELFLRSTLLKPTDFYGHQQLAALVVREAYLWGPEFIGADKLEDALTHAETARQLRPGSSTTFIVLSQLFSLKWVQSDPAERLKYAELVAGSLADAKAVNRYPERVAIPVTESWLLWNFLQLRDSDVSDFEEARSRLLEESNKAKAFAERENTTWEAHNLHRAAAALIPLLQDTKAEERLRLHWPSQRFVSPRAHPPRP